MEKKNVLKADQIYRIMTEMKNGICSMANPQSYTNKIIDSQDPIVTVRQNKTNELEVVSPLPIAIANSLSPLKIDEICRITMSVNKNLPRSNIAFVDEKVANIVKSKLFSRVRNGQDGGRGSSNDKHNEDQANDKGNNFVYKIMVSHLEEQQNFAVNPMQVGKWFPGMLTVYSD